MMKTILLGCLTGLLSFNGLYANSLEVQETTPHIAFHFSEVDHNTVASFAQELENFYMEVSEEFSFSSDSPLYTNSLCININIYPDIQSLHESLDAIGAPSWCVARATSDTVDIVSPSNPGPSHSEESLMKILKLNIVKALLFNKFGQNNIPYWLAYGVGAVKTNYGNSSHPLKYIPSLIELETSNCNQFNEIGGFQVSYKFVEFIQESYGKETLIDLLSNYQPRKEELYQNWMESLSQ